MRNTATGMLALPLLLFGGSLALATTATRSPHRNRPAGDRVELELAGVLPLPEGRAGILVLREKGKDTLLPLLVPNGRGFAPGASGGSLLGRAIEALGGHVAEVEIERAEESSAAARVTLSQAGKRFDLRALPSESIALAVASGVPIVARRSLVDEEGVTAEDLAKAHAHAKGRAITRL
jgi:hypothetical protein